MANTQHDYQIGDSVLTDFNGAQVPGVIEDKQGDRIFVRLATPWADETGQQTDTAWLSPDRLSPQVGGETASEQALPSPE